MKFTGWVDAGSGAVQRELVRLTGAGLLTVSRIGRQTHYQANERAPIFAELRGIVLKTSGLADELRAALDTSRETTPSTKASWMWTSA